MEKLNPYETGSWKIVNVEDGNISESLQSETLIDTLYEALEVLGWKLVKRKKGEE